MTDRGSGVKTGGVAGRMEKEGKGPTTLFLDLSKRHGKLRGLERVV